MSYNDRVDARFGPGYPNCAANQGRVTLRLDFGLGHVFTVQYQSGAASPLLRAVARIRAINVDPNDPRIYLVHAAGHADGKDRYNVTVAGTYACRPINNPHQPGSQDPSPHSWPVAIDINPANNGFNGGRGDIPDWIIAIFRDEGFTWGGDWGDPMHFENLRWYGAWDGTYPEVDDVALTDKQAAALDFIADNTAGISTVIEMAEGFATAADPAAKNAGKKASLAQEAGFRAGRELRVQEQGNHPAKG